MKFVTDYVRVRDDGKQFVRREVLDVGSKLTLQQAWAHAGRIASELRRDGESLVRVSASGYH